MFAPPDAPGVLPIGNLLPMPGRLKVVLPLPTPYAVLIAANKAA